jgi:hypothetical protein
MAIDEFDVTGQNMEYKAKRDAAVIDATVFGDRFSYDLAGIQKASIEYKGFYGSGDAGYNQVVNRKFGQDSDVLMAVAPQGWGPMYDLTMQPSVITKYDIDTKLKGAVDVDINAMARGAVDDGFQLFAPTVPLTTANSPITSLILDDTLITGATTAGCAVQLHVFSVSGTSASLSMVVQDSPDGTTWTPRLTLNAFTAPGKQRMTLGIGNTINQQVRAIATVTGTNAVFWPLLGFARNVVYA